MPGRSQYHHGQGFLPARHSRTEFPSAETLLDPLKEGHAFLRCGTLLGVNLSHVGNQCFHKHESMTFLRKFRARIKFVEYK